MKEPKRIPIVYSLAVMALVPAGARAQDATDSSNDFAQSGTTGFTELVPHSVDDGASYTLELVQDEQALRSEIAALDAASAQKRQQLELRIRELELKKQREIAADDIREAHSYRRDFQVIPDHGAFRVDLSQPPQWMIGVQVSPSGKEGVVVAGTLPDMPAARAGLRAGDVIRSVNGIRVREVSRLNAIINAAADQRLTFAIQRGGENIEKVITPARQKKLEKAPPRVGRGTTVAPRRSYQVQPRPTDKPSSGRVFELLPPKNAPQARNTGRSPASEELKALRRDIVELRKAIEAISESTSRQEETEGIDEVATEDEPVGDDDEDN